MAEDHHEEYNRKQLEQKELEDKIHRETVKALNTEERFVNYLNQYLPQSVEGFINYYAQMKASWFSYGDDFYKFRNLRENKWRNESVELLKEIFYKKIFNLKCRWIAGEMDLPGIEASCDFDLLEENPLLTEIIEPITRQEFDCFIEFLNYQQASDEEDDDDRVYSHSALEFYHKHKSLLVEGWERLIPAWFHFYDAHFGTAYLMELSLIRQDIEEDYNDFWTENILKKTLTDEQLASWSYLSRIERLNLKADPQKEKEYWEEHNRRYLENKKSKPAYIHISTYDRKKMKEIVEIIETPEVKRLFEATTEWRGRNVRNECIEAEVIYLLEAKGKIPIESNDDYREAIIKAYKSYAMKQKLETLPMVYEEYLEAVAAKKTFNWETDKYGRHSNSELKKRIIAVKKLKGEPENFDFLKKENLK